jgi:hypothetical protein
MNCKLVNLKMCKWKNIEDKEQVVRRVKLNKPMPLH